MLIESGHSNTASPEFVHLPSTRWQLVRVDGPALVEVFQHLAEVNDVRESFRIVNQGTTRGAFVTQRFAEVCLGTPHLVLAMVTWNAQSHGAYLVLRGFVDHPTLARRLVALCFDGGEVRFKNIAGAELAMTVRRPSEHVLGRMFPGQAPWTRGRVVELGSSAVKLCLPTGHRIDASFRAYEREGDPNPGVMKLEVNTSRFGDGDAETRLLPASSTALLRDILFAEHESLDRKCRRYGLQKLGMPLSYKGFPTIWIRRKFANLIRDRAPAGMPHLLPGGVVAMPWDGSPESLVTEAGVPIFLDDQDDERLLGRLACYLPIQEARFERFRGQAGGRAPRR